MARIKMAYLGGGSSCAVWSASLSNSTTSEPSNSLP